jgi:hypothetical protein
MRERVLSGYSGYSGQICPRVIRAKRMMCQSRIRE